jgi:hypothetical protein
MTEPSCKIVHNVLLSSPSVFPGHLIQGLSEVPLVVSDKVQEYVKTKQACVFLKKMKVWPEIAKVSSSS